MSPVPPSVYLKTISGSFAVDGCKLCMVAMAETHWPNMAIAALASCNVHISVLLLDSSVVCDSQCNATAPRMYDSPQKQNSRITLVITLISCMSLVQFCTEHV